ncbi:GDSL-type esterase/lipase family protein [Alkalibaculum sporogenes]|uniref:GDSL-type esterase/lipase family protein n=1 Tax=Alkalibaculum sporogenes TaxID=2655001 RepID=UPI00128C9C7C
MKIVCIGDSLTFGYKLKQSHVWTRLLECKLNIDVINKGINGDTSGGMLSRFYIDVLTLKPSHVIIMGGVNDLIMGVPVSIICSNIMTMVHQANAKAITPIIGIPISSDPELAAINWPNIVDFNYVNNRLQELRKTLYIYGNAFNIKILDFYQVISDLITQSNKLIYYIDGLHLTSIGNQVLVDSINI